MPAPAQCPVPLVPPCTTFVNTLITSFRSPHLVIAHPDASGAHVTIDPTPFLSTIVTTSAALVAIIGGLLVAKFVGLDSDQRASRKILAGARGRLELAQRRFQAAWQDVLRWDAESFFGMREVVEGVVDKGVVSPTELMRMASWQHEPGSLNGYTGDSGSAVRRKEVRHGRHAKPLRRIAALAHRWLVLPERVWIHPSGS